jgi:methionyl-tRNA formyltransferase
VTDTAPPLRIVFFGTAELACFSLKALATSPQFQVSAVVTQPDRPKGRDLKLQPPAVKIEANRHGLPVLQPVRAKDSSFIEQMAALAPDLGVVAAYGQILSKALLDTPRFGCVNVHTSLLPKYRGAAPIQWAILNGDAVTGVTIMQMDPGLDTGPILSQAETPISPEDTAQSLHDRLAQMGADLLIQTIPAFVSGRIVPEPQPASGSSYARKITKEDGCLDWHLPAGQLWNRIRALTPWPGAYTFLPHPTQQPLLKVWKATVVDDVQGAAPGEVLDVGRTGITVACAERALLIVELQREGGRRLDAAQFLAGHRLKPGDRLGKRPAVGS